MLWVAGCSQGNGLSAEQSIVQVGSTKAALFGPPAEFRALHPRLETCFGRPVRFRAQPNGQALATQLQQGHIHYAIMSAAEYASAENTGALSLVATGVNALGRTARTALLVVKADSKLRNLADCRGQRFAFGTHGDLLTDLAVQRALETAGVPVKELLTELLPPPLAFEGRLYLKNDVARMIANDLTLNAGVIDELYYSKMPATGGDLITGPSTDQFRVVGRTMSVPELVVVAGPGADPSLTTKLADSLLNQLDGDDPACKQLGIQGFRMADKEAYETVRLLLRAPRAE
jgi:ABC-type phosphate/phosphonate transport system substrate-binding protein